MKKRMTLMILFLVIVFGGIFGWDAVRAYFMGQYFANYQPPPASVSTVAAKQETLTPTLTSVGTLIAENGVTLSSQVAGIVSQIDFHSGDTVQKGQLLIKLDDSVEQAELKNSEAALALAKLDFERNQNLLKRKAVSQADFDQARATYQQDEAAVEKIQALINQKNISAPFSGRLGIRSVNLGQYISPGTAIVTLQAIKPIFVNFYLPEQDLPKISVGQTVQATVDTYPHKVFDGKISAINSEVDTKTHNVLVQATFPNQNEKLYPGLFAVIHVLEPQTKQVIVVPNTAVTFTLFGNSVYVVETPKKEDKNKAGEEIYKVKQVFVKTGKQTKQDIVIAQGLKAGEQVVTSGQLKLTNGTQVVINNAIQLDKKQNEIY